MWKPCPPRPNRAWLLALAGLLPLLALAQPSRQPSSQQRCDTLLGRMRPARAYHVQHIALQLRIDTAQPRLQGRCQLRLQPLQPLDSLQLDLHPRFRIDSLVLDGQALALGTVRRQGPALFIPLGKKRTKALQLRVVYGGMPVLAPLAPWQGGYVWARDDLGRPFYGFACQGQGAHLLFPCLDHALGRADSASIAITVPLGLQAVGNGQLRQVDTTGRSSTYTWACTYPIHPYNLSFYVGHYTYMPGSYTCGNGQALRLHYWVLSYAEKWARPHLGQVRPMLQHYDSLYGCYPWPRDGYKLVQAPYWGMEHQSAIAYGNGWVNLKKPYDVDFIIVHESAHEWWGNSVGATDRADMWLQEGLTTYTETLLLERLRGPEIALAYLAEQRKKIVNLQPLLGPRGCYHSHTDTDIYYKGAWAMHTLRQVLGSDSLFFAGLKATYQQLQHQQVSSQQLQAALAQHYGRDLSAFWASYLQQAAVPQLQHSQQGQVLHYRLAQCHPGLVLPVPVQQGGQVQATVQASTQWQQLRLPSASPAVPQLQQLLLESKWVKP